MDPDELQGPDLLAKTPQPGPAGGAPPAPAGRRRAESERRRAKILEAARACFGREGYAGATVARIAEEAGVSNGLLYKFFRNKDHLLEVVLKDVVRDWVRALVPREDEEDRPAVALEQMVRRSVAFCATNPLLPALLSRDPALQLQRIKAAAEGRLEAHRELVARVARRGVERGEFRPDLDVESFADVVVQLTAEYSRRAYTDDPDYPVNDRIVDAVVRFILDAARGGPSA